MLASEKMRCIIVTVTFAYDGYCIENVQTRYMAECTMEEGQAAGSVVLAGANLMSLHDGKIRDVSLRFV